ncbi:hypothetical protein EWM60_11090, partial [Candidatus Erwinia dacicola]|nr:hypothetical protein [Candidatus Erwinia dacicola]
MPARLTWTDAGRLSEWVSASQKPKRSGWPSCLDATYVKVRKNGRVVSVAVIIACAVNLDGRREIIGMGIGESEAKAFWLAFLL